MAVLPFKSFFPTADELLAADLPRLGEVLLVHLSSYEGRVKQHGRLNQGYLLAMLENRNVGLGPLPPAPEYGPKQPEVTRRVMEAWNWLERQGFLIPDPSVHGWHLITTEGERLLANGATSEQFESLGRGSRGRIQSAVLDLFKEDASTRPLGDNPFPPDHPAHEAFEESTWEAKEAIGKLQSDLLVPYNAPSELLQSIFKFRTAYFNVVVKQAMCIVGDGESARRYESWINDFARFYLDDTVSRIKCNDPNADPKAPPYFDPESVAGFERDLTFELMRLVGHYKTEAASVVLRMKKEKLNAAKNTRRRGRRPNEDRRDAIHNAITKYGDQWRHQLSGIFAELDNQDVSLGKFEGFKIDLGDGTSTTVEKWEDLDLAEGEQRRQIIDVLRKYAD